MQPATEPFLKEVSRTTPGMTASMLYLLIGAGVLFLGLLISGPTVLEQRALIELGKTVFRFRIS